MCGTIVSFGKFTKENLTLQNVLNEDMQPPPQASSDPSLILLHYSTGTEICHHAAAENSCRNSYMVLAKQFG